MGLKSTSIIDFSKIYKEDLDIVGKKAIELSELKRIGIPIPDGFVITTNFFKEFLDQTGIAEKIAEIQKLNHPSIQDSVEKMFHPIKKQIIHTTIPLNLSSQLHAFYRKLSGNFKDKSLNIFTSSLSNNSICYTKVKGDANLVLKIKEIWASHIDRPVAIVVQKNVESKIKGKIFTNNLLISGQKELADVQVNRLINFAKKIQKHFYFPQELDYIVEKGKIYITGIKPFTPHPIAPSFEKPHQPIIKGLPINPGIATGPARIFNQNLNSFQIKKDEIVVLPKLNISLYKNLRNAKAVIIETMLLTPYDRMIYRKIFKAPTIIGAKNAARILRNGNVVTVNGISGEIYKGGLI